MPSAVPTHEVRSGRHHAMIMVVTDRPCSRQQASDWIRWAVTQAGGDSTRFSGISARKGCISAAIEARVDEAILYLQRGHGQALQHTCTSRHPIASSKRLRPSAFDWPGLLSTLSSYARLSGIARPGMHARDACRRQHYQLAQSSRWGVSSRPLGIEVGW